MTEMNDPGAELRGIVRSARNWIVGGPIPCSQKKEKTKQSFGVWTRLRIEEIPTVYVAATGAANLASIRAGLERAGAAAFVTDDPDLIANADLALLPGVGNFGPAMRRLTETGMAGAFARRMESGLPVMGICLGMQLFFDRSDESPGVPGMGLISGSMGRFSGDLPLPQLGWNRVRGSGSLVRDGWAYFANSFRLGAAPPGYRIATAEYGEPFVAALENDSGSALFCQFHPELSGTWGRELLARWIEKNAKNAGKEIRP